MAEEPRRVALVTGASRGIGRCAAVALARRGFDVVITARTVKEGDGRAQPSSVLAPDEATPIAGSLESTAADIEAHGRTCLAVPMDLMDRSSVEAAAAAALGFRGRVDVLVNNAIYQGPGTMDRILDLPLELAERCLVGDYLHPLLLIQLVLPQMLERGEGRLVNMLSEAAFTTPPAPVGPGRVGRRLCGGQGRLPSGDRHVPGGVRRRRHHGLLHCAGPHPDRVDARLGHGQGAHGSRARARAARGGG